MIQYKQNKFIIRGETMNNVTKIINKENLPIIMSVHDMQAIGFSRSMSYQLLNRADVPVITIGGRKFINRDKFFQWLDTQTN